MMQVKVWLAALLCALAAGCATADPSAFNAARAACDNTEDALTPDQQIAACNRAILLSNLHDREMPWMLSDRARAYASRGSLDLALADLDQAQFLSPANEALFVTRSFVLTKKGDTAAALAALDAAIAINPRLDSLYFARGRLLYAERKYEAAISDFSAALRIDSSNNEARFLRARSYIFTRAAPRALGDLDALVSDKPGDPDFLFWRGRVRLDQKDYQGALNDLTESIRLDPKDAMTPLYWRGRAYLWSGDKDHAIADFDEAVRLEPQSVDALSSKCWGRLNANRELDVALAACDAALALAPKDLLPLFYRAIILLKQGDNTGAVGAFDTCAQTSAPVADEAYDDKELASTGFCLYGRGMAKLRLAGTDEARRAEASRELLVASAASPNAAGLFAGLGVAP